MKASRVILALIGMIIVGGGVAAAVTNPSQAAYDEFAAEQLTQYLKDNVCTKSEGILSLIQGQCSSIIEDNRGTLQKIISSNTERQNFLVLSVYKTDLSTEQYLPDILSNSIPSYHFETVGVLQNFYIYKTEENQGNRE
jgi:Domain of unknown function (DUF4359)